MDLVDKILAIIWVTSFTVGIGSFYFLPVKYFKYYDLLSFRQFGFVTLIVCAALGIKAIING